MFTILKPEMRRCIGTLDPYLAEAGFEIKSRHPIRSWDSLAKELYATQIIQDPQFSSEINVYLWMVQNLFGNNAIAYKLTKKGNSRQNLEDLMRLKRRFREETSLRLDNPITFLINLDKINIPQEKVIGKNGILRIGEIPLEEGSFKGRWDYFFFKYIHTSDSLEDYIRENNVLERRKIYDNQINEEQWEQMIRLGTLVPLL